MQCGWGSTWRTTRRSSWSTRWLSRELLQGARLNSQQWVVTRMAASLNTCQGCLTKAKVAPKPCGLLCVEPRVETLRSFVCWDSAGFKKKMIFEGAGKWLPPSLATPQTCKLWPLPVWQMDGGLCFLNSQCCSMYCINAVLVCLYVRVSEIGRYSRCKPIKPICLSQSQLGLNIFTYH